MNKKTLVLLIITMLLLSTLMFLFNIGSTAEARTLNIGTSGKSTIIYNMSVHYDFPDAYEMSNGNWIVAFSHGLAHNGPHSIECQISSNHGASWGSTILICAAESYTTKDPCIGVTANGNVICTRRSDIGGTSNHGEWYVSYNNGSTWTYKGYIDNNNCYNLRQMRTINGVTYGAGFYLASDGVSGHLRLYKTTNNGSSWTLVNADLAGEDWGDEWGFIDINNTHWIAMSRCDKYATTKFTQTYDAGLTWESWTDIYSKVGQFHDPKLHYLNAAEDVIILSGRNVTTTVLYTCFWVSEDYGVTWKNYTVVDTCAAAAYGGDGGYTGYVEQADSGYLVWYNGDMCDYGGPGFPCTTGVYGCYVYDNTTYSEIQFVNISDKTNGSIITDTTPTMVWNKVNQNIINYNLQIATDTNFVNLVVNISDINELMYPSYYSEDDDYVTFILPNEYALPSANLYYFRVRGMY